MATNKNNRQLTDEASSFLISLIELCGIYRVDANGFIKHNPTGHYLGVEFHPDHERIKKISKIVTFRRVSSLKIESPKISFYRVFREGMESQNRTKIFFPLSVGSLEMDWLIMHVERACAHLTKKIILTVVDGIIENSLIKNYYNGDLLHFNQLNGKSGIKIFNEIIKIPEKDLLAIKYNKETCTASAQSNICSATSRKTFTREVLTTILSEIFFSDKHTSGAATFKDRFLKKRDEGKSKYLYTNLYVLIELLGELDRWAYNFLNYDLKIEKLAGHLADFDNYLLATTWISIVSSHPYSIIGLVGENNTFFPEDDSFKDFYFPLNIEKRSNQVIFFSQGSFNDYLDFYKNNNIPIWNTTVPQISISKDELEKNGTTYDFNGDIESYLSGTIKTLNIPDTRDYDHEYNCIRFEKILLNLLLTLERPKELQKWLPGITCNGIHFAYKGMSINLNEHLYNLNCPSSIIPKYNYSQWPELSGLSGFQNNNFIMLYAMINGCADSKGVLNYDLTLSSLANKFQIDKKNFLTPVSIPDTTSWYRSDDAGFYYRDLGSKPKFIVFRTENGAVDYCLAYYKKKEKTVLLPITNFGKSYETPASFHIMPNRDKFPLMNLDLIANNSHAKIILTDNIELAYKHGAGIEREVIWSSWYGKKNAIKHVDWNPLKGRTVYYLCDDIQSKEAISTTLDVLSALNDISFGYLSIFGVENNKELKNFKHSELLKIAKRKKCYIPKELEKLVQGEIRTNIKKQYTKEYIINGVLELGSLAMIYAPAGIGKTWLALAIAKAVANGEDVFQGWIISSEPRGVAYFAGEMAVNDLEYRWGVINNIYAESENRNLLSRRLDDLDLATSESQNIVDRIIDTYEHENNIKISLLIIDNINTLAKTSTTDKGWQSFHTWLKKKKGITTILIHHPNKEGNYLGTSMIKNMIDLMIYAGDENDFKLKLAKLLNAKEVVLAERLRSTSPKDISMFISAPKMRLDNKLTQFWLSLENIEVEPRWDVIYPYYDKLLEKKGYSPNILSEMLDKNYSGISLKLETNKPNNNDDDDDDGDGDGDGGGGGGGDGDGGDGGDGGGGGDRGNGPKDDGPEADRPRGDWVKGDFLKLVKERQKLIIEDLYSSSPKGMTGVKMAKILKISTRSLNTIRKDTATLVEDLKRY